MRTAKRGRRTTESRLVETIATPGPLNTLVTYAKQPLNP